MASTRIAREFAQIARNLLKVVFVLYVPIMAALTCLHFPYDTDQSIERASDAKSVAQRSAVFYEVAYKAGVNEKRGLDYEKTARAAAEAESIEDKVKKFVADYGLQKARVLEVGSGRGYLQDIVEDYTGLDISSEVASHYHKKFVLGSATEMPFSDNSFDAIWSIWVLEHIPQPEKVLNEMRRVLKPGGILYLYPAWNCPPWAAEGFEVRPYKDFNWRGKLVKASLPVRSSPFFRAFYLLPTRVIRKVQYSFGGPSTQLRFRALAPNYEVYWRPDSDAAISLDSYEAYLWFRSRGDACLNCKQPSEEIASSQSMLVIRVAKSPGTQQAGTD